MTDGNSSGEDDSVVVLSKEDDEEEVSKWTPDVGVLKLVEVEDLL